jgi:hypothetical protein
MMCSCVRAQIPSIPNYKSLRYFKVHEFYHAYRNTYIFRCIIKLVKRIHSASLVPNSSVVFFLLHKSIIQISIYYFSLATNLHYKSAADLSK